MVYKSRYTDETYSPGATRVKRTFAWLPFQINGDMVWLENYETLQLYTVEDIPVGEKAYRISKWIDLSHKIITK